MTVTELRQKRAKLVEEARSLYTRAENEKRELSAEESQQFDTMMGEAEQLGQSVSRLERLSAFEDDQRSSRGRVTRDSIATRANNDAVRGWLLLGSDVRVSDEMRSAVDSAEFINGKTLRLDLRADALRSVNEFHAWQNRAQAIGTGAAGGYTVAQDFAGEVERAMLAFGGMRQASRVIRTATGAALPWPLSDDTANEATIIGENTEIPDTPDIAFDSTTLVAYKYTSNIVKVSTELLQDSAVNIPELVGSMLGERIARGTNRHFTVGTGTNQPEGAVTGSVLGVTAAAQATVTYDELVDLVHSVDPAYRANAKFMFNDSTLKALKKLKDAQGRPLWKAGLAEGEPDTIDGYSYIINQHMAPMGAGVKSIVFGDFSKHLIRDVQDIVLVRLDERYAEFGQVAFVALSRHDSRMLDAGQHPIRHLKNAA